MTKQNQLVEMKEREYDSEDVLQKILASFPTLLLSEEEVAKGKGLLLIRREIDVPSDQDGFGRWSLDHLFITHDGVPIIVEVKRRTDTRIRREVVGQMLDYASNGIVYWQVDQLQNDFEENCKKENIDSNEVMFNFLGDGYPEEKFWDNVRTNLQAGKIKMVFVADSIPKELRRIVEFLNEQMALAEVIAIEVKQYKEGEHIAFVPTIIGQTEEASSRKSTSRRILRSVDSILAEATENARLLFQSIFELNGKYDFRAGPGVKGFFLHIRIGDREVPVCWGYSNSEGPKESIIVKFSRMVDVNNNDEIIKKYKSILLGTGYFRPSGKEEIKVTFEKKIEKEAADKIIDILRDMGNEIKSNGLG